MHASEVEVLDQGLEVIRSDGEYAFSPMGTIFSLTTMVRAQYPAYPHDEVVLIDGAEVEAGLPGKNQGPSAF